MTLERMAGLKTTGKKYDAVALQSRPYGVSWELSNALINTATYGWSGTLVLFEPSSTNRKLMTFSGGGWASTTVTAQAYGGGGHTTATAINNIRFKMDTGNITTGTFKLYGVL